MSKLIFLGYMEFELDKINKSIRDIVDSMDISLEWIAYHNDDYKELIVEQKMLIKIIKEYKKLYGEQIKVERGYCVEFKVK